MMSLLLLLGLLFTVGECGGSSPPPPKPTTTTHAPTPKATQPAVHDPHDQQPNPYERLANDNIKKVKCTSDADCTGTHKCDFTWDKVVKGTRYGMCKDTTCANGSGDEYCKEFSLESHCNFDLYRNYYGNDYDWAKEMDTVCQKSCDPHCYGSAPLILKRGGLGGDFQRLGKMGEFCSHHVECEGDLLCDYTMNTVKIGGYSMGICRKEGCTEAYGLGAVYNCDSERDDPRECGPDFNMRWEACRATCDPNCYGARINHEYWKAWVGTERGVDDNLVTMHTGETVQSTPAFVQVMAAVGFAFTIYGAGKFYLSK